MKYNNYIRCLEKTYNIEINKEIRNTLGEYFGNDLNAYTEQDLYETSERNIKIYTIKHLKNMYKEYKNITK